MGLIIIIGLFLGAIFGRPRTQVVCDGVLAAIYLVLFLASGGILNLIIAAVWMWCFYGDIQKLNRF